MVDHERLFRLSRFTDDQARQILADPKQCCGLILYATEAAFKSDFIRTVEIPAALRRLNFDHSFRIATIPRGIDHKRLSERSLELWGEDLARPFTLPSLPSGPLSPAAVKHTTLEILDNYAPSIVVNSPILLNLSTRDYIEPGPDVAFDVDARWLLREDISDGSAWANLRQALEDLKTVMRRYRARPTILLTGSKHLTAGLMVGRVFGSPIVEELRVLQSHATWSTRQTAFPERLLTVNVEDANAASTEIAVAVSATDHDPRVAMRRYLQDQGIECHRLGFICPVDGPVRGAVGDARSAFTMATEVRSALVGMASASLTTKIHLFLAMPQGLAVFIGHLANGLPPLQLHEFVAGSYVASALVT
jgi:hypothetical protein